MRIFSNFKKISLSLTAFNLLIAAWMAGFTNLSFYRHIASFSSLSSLSLYAFITVTFFVLSALYFFVLQILNWRASAKTISSILVFITGISSYFVNQLGVNINTDQIQNIVQTNVNEAFDLLSLPFILWFILTVILPLSVIFFIRIKPANTVGQLVLKKSAGLAAAFVVMAAGLFAFYSQYAPIFRENRELKAQISPLNILSSSWSYAHKNAANRNLPLIRYGEDAHQINQTAQQPAQVLVLVVGETARAQNFSLNGYNRLTNPELSQLDIVNFTQASSCGTQTSVSVPCMFSGMTRKDYDATLASHREGLLDIAQRAGYEVTWIDNNSGCKGACDRIKNYISPKDLPQYKQWCKSGECDDQVLFLALNQYLSQLGTQNLKKNQLIVLHQMGSHGPAYYRRYPAQFKKFVPVCETNDIQNCDHESLINTYDNSILYTDHLIANSIKMLKQAPFPAGLIYLSDHGESTGEKGLYLHGTPYFMAPKEQTHIPMLFWTSQRWPQHQSIQDCLMKQKDHTVSQDNLFPTVLGLLNIHTKVSDPTLDLLAQCKGSI